MRSALERTTPQPPPLLVLDDATTHALIDVSHTAGAWQSAELPHEVWQLPWLPQVYGAHALATPSLSIDCVPSVEQYAP